MLNQILETGGNPLKELLQRTQSISTNSKRQNAQTVVMQPNAIITRQTRTQEDKNKYSFRTIHNLILQFLASAGDTKIISTGKI